MKLIKNWVLLILYALATAYLFQNVAYSWPYAGDIQTLLFLLVGPALVYQLLFISYTFLFKSLLSKTFLLRIISFFVGLGLAGSLMSYSSTLSMKRFETVYQNMPSYIDLTKTNPCLIRFWQTDEVLNYNQTVNKFIGKSNKPIGRLWYNKLLFIIELRGGGEIGTDGSTIFFNSTTKQWVFFDNEDKEKRTLFLSTISNLKECHF